jgi:hypothetical protein
VWLSKTARLTGRYGKKLRASALRIVNKIEYRRGMPAVDP